MNKSTLLSFHGNQKIKDKYLKRLQLHHDADEIIKGKYWEKGKGCAVGCTIHSGKHDNYDTELGITWRLALLEDSLFEKLPNKEAKEFPLQFIKLMPVGVDTNIIFKKFILWNLVDEKDGLIYHIRGKKEIAILNKIAAAYQRSFTEEISDSEWKELGDETAYAYAYASSYAYAYASSYPYAYASSYPYAYASDERILQMRDKLLFLIAESGNQKYPDLTNELAKLPIDETPDKIVQPLHHESPSSFIILCSNETR